MRKYRLRLLASTILTGSVVAGAQDRVSIENLNWKLLESGAVEIAAVDGQMITVPASGFDISDTGILSVDAIFASAIFGGGGLALLLVVGLNTGDGISWDRREGTEASDSLIFGLSAGAGENVRLVVSTQGGDDQITFADQAGGEQGNVLVNAGEGDDRVYFGQDAGVRSGSVTVNAGDGSNRVSFQALAGREGGSIDVSGGGGDDTIIFGADADNASDGNIVPGAGVANAGLSVLNLTATEEDDGNSVIQVAALGQGARVTVDAGNGNNQILVGKDGTVGLASSIQVTAGAGNDEIEFGESAAKAGWIAVDVGSGNNDIAFGFMAGGNRANASTDDNDKNLVLIAGDGNDTITFAERSDDDTSASPAAFREGARVSVNAGNGNNQILVGKDGTVGLASSIQVTAGAGNDEIQFGSSAAKSGSITVNAGDGDDTIGFGSNAAANTIDGEIVENITINAGEGIDTVSFGDDAARNGAIQIYLGIDDEAGADGSEADGHLVDTLTFGNYAAEKGRITVTGDATRANKVTFGNDAASSSSGLVEVGAGAGNDEIIFGHRAANYGSIVVDTGVGDDRITFGDNAASGYERGIDYNIKIVAGEGTDTVSFGDNAAQEGAIQVHLGIDNETAANGSEATRDLFDTLTFGGNAAAKGTITVTGDANQADKVTFGNSAAKSGAIIVRAGGGDNDISFGYRAGGEDATALGGVGGGAVELYAGDGNDTVTFGEREGTSNKNDGVPQAFGRGSTIKVELGNGNNEVSVGKNIDPTHQDRDVGSTRDVRFTAGNGDDDFEFGHRAAKSGLLKIEAGDGTNDISFGAFAARNADGIIDVDTGKGNDTIQFEQSLAGYGSVDVNAGDGNDTISFDHHAAQFGELTVNAGNGSDTIDFNENAAAGSANQDSGKITINAGEGADRISFADTAAKYGDILIDLGSDEDVDTLTFTIGAYGNGLKNIYGQVGSITVTGAGDGDQLVFTNETVSADGIGSTTVTLKTDKRTIVISDENAINGMVNAAGTMFSITAG